MIENTYNPSWIFFLSKQTQYWLQSWRVYKSDFIAIFIDLMFPCIDQRLSKPSERKLMVNGAILNLSSHTRDTSRKKKALPCNKNWQRFIHPSLEKLSDYFYNHWWKDLFSGTIIFSFFFPHIKNDSSIIYLTEGPSWGALLKETEMQTRKAISPLSASFTRAP